MKRFNFRAWFMSIALGVAAHTGAVGANDHCTGPGVVDTDEYADHILRRLGDGNVVGFGFAIYEGNSVVATGHGGFARIPFLDGNVPFTVPFNVATDINVFSASKTLTAIALLQLMNKLSVTPDDAIEPWLPQEWTRGAGFDASGISFEDLLTHRTGLLQASAQHSIDGTEYASPNTWQGLEFLVAGGVAQKLAATSCPTVNEDDEYELGDLQDPQPGHYGVGCYKNANYALAAILITQMGIETEDLDMSFGEGKDTEVLAKSSAAGYENYVRANVLQPVGVDGSCTASGPDLSRALAYDIHGNVPGEMLTAGSSTLTDGLLSCGPKNWWLSALDLAAVAAGQKCGALLSPESRELMDSLLLGWSPASNSGANANRYWHRGYGFFTRDAQPQLLWPEHPDNPTEDQVIEAKGLAVNTVSSCVMKLPFGISTSLVMNSNLRDSDDRACDVLLQAFDAAL